MTDLLTPPEAPSDGTYVGADGGLYERPAWLDAAEAERANRTRRRTKTIIMTLVFGLLVTVVSIGMFIAFMTVVFADSGGAAGGCGGG